MLCKNCKHFSRTAQFEGKCLNRNFKYGYGQSFTDYDTEDNFYNVHPNQVLIEDDEGWGMYVGQDFGCIHFDDASK